MTSQPFREGQLIRIAEGMLSDWVTVDLARQVPTGWQLYVKDGAGAFHKLDLTEDQARAVTVLTNDGAADSARVLAGLWTCWMDAASASSRTTLLASAPLRPYPHQANAVYGAMLPQPRLRFLLADEPGTGKTIMAGLYLREMQKLGLIRRALVVAPAGLVSKWQADFERFFAGGLWRITNETVKQHGLAIPHDLWIVSLELAAINPAVQEAIRPDQAGWDAVVFDKVHRLTPTAETFHRAGALLAKNTARALFMTATPHRGKEWLFRHLLHLVDPEVYPEPGSDKDAPLRPVKPGPVHFLRRMKEDLVDYDGVTPLFKSRRAHNVMVSLNVSEDAFYREALVLQFPFREVFQPTTLMGLLGSALMGAPPAGPGDDLGGVPGDRPGEPDEQAPQFGDGDAEVSGAGDAPFFAAVATAARASSARVICRYQPCQLRTS